MRRPWTMPRGEERYTGIFGSDSLLMQPLLRLIPPQIDPNTNASHIVTIYDIDN